MPNIGLQLHKRLPPKEYNQLHRDHQVRRIALSRLGTLQCTPHATRDMGGCTGLSLIQLHPLKPLKGAQQLTGVLNRM